MVDSSNPEEAWAAIAKAPIDLSRSQARLRIPHFWISFPTKRWRLENKLFTRKLHRILKFLLRLQLIGGRRLFGRSLKRNSLDESGQRP